MLIRQAALDLLPLPSTPPYPGNAMTPPREIIRIGPIEIRFLLDGDDTAGRLSVFEFLVPPGVRVPAPHYHEQVDEVAYGLEGVLTFTVDGRDNRIGPGDRCFIPRGAVHHFVNAGTEPTRTLSVLTPLSLGPSPLGAQPFQISDFLVDFLGIC